MKQLMAIALLGAAATSCAAFGDPALYGLRTPSGLTAHQLVLDIEHRIYGTVTDTLLGFEFGANVGLGLRYHVWSGLEVNAGFVRDRREVDAGASYAYFIRPLHLHTQASLQFANYLDYVSGRRTNALLGLLCFQTAPLLRTFTPSAELGYDFEARQIALGVGLGAGIPVAFGPVKRVGLAVEYYPHVRSDTLANCYAGALVVETWGHQFMLGVGNSSALGDRFLMRGTAAQDLHVGFSIRRKLDLAMF